MVKYVDTVCRIVTSTTSICRNNLAASETISPDDEFQYPFESGDSINIFNMS